MRQYTVEQIKARTFGGLSIQHRLQADQCHETLMDGNQWRTKQCSRSHGYGLGGLFCKQHAKRYPAEQEGK